MIPVRIILRYDTNTTDWYWKIPGSSSDKGYAEWQQAAKAALNTLGSSADIAEPTLRYALEFAMRTGRPVDYNGEFYNPRREDGRREINALLQYLDISDALS